MIGQDTVVPEAQKSARQNLGLRVVSALILAPLALVTSYLGGWPFVVFWLVASLAVWWEWVSLVAATEYRAAFVTGACALALAAGFGGIQHFEMSLLIAALGALGVTVTASRSPIWIASGLLYAATLLLASLAVRLGMDEGNLAILFLFAVVWTTDIAAFFVGKTVGGPKLAPAISPKKTWAGAIGGTAGAVVAAIIFGLVIGSGFSWPLALLALGLSIVAQFGDLFESFMKRKFGAKDSSHLIPGHGGAMDRLDGFIAAALALALLDTGIALLAAPGTGSFPW